VARPRPELSADLRALKKSLASDIGLLGVLRRDEKLTGRPDPRTAALVAKIAGASREVKIRELIETAPPLPAEVRDRLARALAGADVESPEWDFGVRIWV
jgi:hypothetical protein